MIGIPLVGVVTMVGATSGMGTSGVALEKEVAHIGRYRLSKAGGSTQCSSPIRDGAQWMWVMVEPRVAAGRDPFPFGYPGGL